MDRTSFYEWKRRFQTHRLEGLKDLPPIHKTHPQTTQPEKVEKILKASMEHPHRGCCKLSDWLKLQGISVSSPTIQNILTKNQMGSRYEYLLRLEEKALKEGLELTPQQVALIEKYNPCFKKRHVESKKTRRTALPGHLPGGQNQRGGQDIPSGGGGHLQFLCFRLSSHRQAAGVCGGDYAQ